MQDDRVENPKDAQLIISSYEMREHIREQGDYKPLVNVRSKFPSLDYAIENFHDGELIAISGPTKNGKCMKEGTLLLMHDGSIKAIQDVRVGDKLMGDDSNPRTVLSTCSGFSKLYKIHPWQGTPYSVNKEHILCLQRTHAKNTKTDNLNGAIREITVEDYIKLSKTQKHLLKTYRVPVDFPSKPVKIHPYLLGLWLGDGHSNTSEITTADPEIVEFLKDYTVINGYSLSIKDQPGNASKIYRICDPSERKNHRNRFLDDLRAYNLINNKHIPLEYKANSRDVRLQLLAGLIDTDGNYVKSTRGGALEFVSKSQTLIDDVAYLCRSLGYACTPHKTTKKIKSTGFEGEYWTMRIGGDTTQIPCRIQRKIRNGMVPFKNVLRSSFKIEHDGFGKYYGFVLDGNGRYLLSDFQVTHNTLFAQTLTKNFSDQQYFSLWFSYEVTPRGFINCFDEKDLPMFYMPKELEARNMDWVERKILEGLKQHNTRIVFVDHLHYLFDLVSRQNVSLTIGNVVRRLKGIAVKNKLIIFLLCHTAKPGGEGGGLSYLSIRDSSFVAQESDTVFMVQRNGKETGQVRVEFHRRTGCFNEIIPIIKQGKYFQEMAVEAPGGEYHESYKKRRA